MQLRSISALGILILLPLLSWGCTNAQPTRFYVLSTIADQAAVAPGSGVAVGVGPVNLPQYLNRPQIVTRLGDNRLAVADFDQWGGELDDNFIRALAANLSSLLRTDRVSLFPWKDGVPIDYQVTVDVLNFEQNADGTSVLSASWSIVDPATGKVRLMRRSTYHDASGQVPPGSAEEPVTGKEHTDRPYDGVVAAMSRNLATLSQDIAVAISSQSGG
jgi:uncharacterized lipoprotein YmbA